jgi:16S rRNA processing protein RimM
MPQLVPVGRVGRPHGLDGAFVVERPSDDDRRYQVGGVLLVDGVPATIVLSRRAGGRRRAIKLDRPVERGQQLAVDRADLPPADEGHFYVFELVGLTVVDETGREAATVLEVRPGVANDILALSDGALVPMIEDAVLEIDLEGSRVVVAAAFLG